MATDWRSRTMSAVRASSDPWAVVVDRVAPDLDGSGPTDTDVLCVAVLTSTVAEPTAETLALLAARVNALWALRVLTLAPALTGVSTPVDDGPLRVAPRADGGCVACTRFPLVGPSFRLPCGHHVHATPMCATALRGVFGLRCAAPECRRPLWSTTTATATARRPAVSGPLPGIPVVPATTVVVATPCA